MTPPRPGDRARPPAPGGAGGRGGAGGPGGPDAGFDGGDGREARPEIRVLPDEVIDQIAAGEVVERPASVVKELCENALDAGATHITVEIEQGGVQLIRVVDNGAGMAPAQARMALRRHATSKLRTLDDLYALHTMGFRGEALPSIAAVSRLTVVTRTRDEVAGTRLHVEAGEIVGEGEVGAPVGTRVEVRDLLGNVPARLKFLKGTATEASHITDAVTRLALAHPRVHLRLRHGARTSIDAPFHDTPRERVQALLGTRIGRRLHHVAGEEAGVVVDAYLAAPEAAQTTTRGLQLFVGRRAIRDRGLVQAVRMGYGELLHKGRYPVAVVFVDVPEGAVDVNVHPQKQEVRFSDAGAVYAAVRHAIRRGVAAAPWLGEGAQPGVSPVKMRALAARVPPTSRAADVTAQYARATERLLLPFGRGGDDRRGFERAGARPDDRAQPDDGARDRALRETAFPVAGLGARARPPDADDDADAHAHGKDGAPGGAGPLSVWRTSGAGPRAEGDHGRGEAARGTSGAREGGAPVYEPRTPDGGGRAAHPAGAPGAPEAPGSRASADPAATDDPGADRAHTQAHGDRASADAARAEGGFAGAGQGLGPDAFFSRLHYIGQLDRTYLVCETDGELVLVDQHAAHERVAFQRLRERYRERSIPVQRLLFPEQIDLSPDQAAVAEDSDDALAALGFEVAPFGGDTWALKTVPAGLREGDSPAAVLGELLRDLAERGGSRALEERLDLALATIACHSVVRAGDVLSAREVHALFQALDGVEFRAHCPHGRPVLLRVSIAEIARRFGRS